MRVALHHDPKSSRSSNVANAMAAGVQACGDHAVMVSDFSGPVLNCGVGVAYGWAHPQLFGQYRAWGGTYVYADLGWWDRKPPLRPMDGYHKLVVGGRDPLAYFRRGSDDSRFRAFGLGVAPWRRSGRFILLAGMSAKSAGTRGFKPYEWELAAIERIRRYTDRPIVYRPKPSWAEAKPLPGCGWSGPNVPVEQALKDCWAVVTLHSNVAVDGLCAGVPCVADEGVASVLSGRYEDLEAPPLPDGREQLMADVAYCQWTIAEMRSGEAWRYFRREGLI